VARYLIEVTHESETLACARAIKLLLQTGSHFLTHADFGCMDNDHRAWIVVEADSKEEARNLVPAIYRTRATVTGLNKFSLEEIDALIKQHGM
jgi:hypothetical protein